MNRLSLPHCWKFHPLLIVAALALLLAMSGVGAAKADSGPTFSYNLSPPNTAMGPDGDTIRLNGSGIFDPGAGTVSSSGAFTIIKSDGSVEARGTWQATAFTSFDSFGGRSPGFQGGVLDITATFFPEGSSPHTGIPMSITCRVNAPPGFTGEEGTTAGPFTEKTGGTTLFHQGS